MPVGCALAGAGSWGSLIAAEIARVDGLELLYVTDPAGDPLLPGVASVETLEPALADPAVQAVIVAAPNHQHVPLALQAVAAGRHVLLEKPVALTVAELDPLIEVASAAGCVVMPNHVMRYYEPLAEVHRIVSGGLIGRPLAARVERRDLLTRTKPWLQQRESVGGMLYQSTCHEFDLLRWLLGDVVQIWCQSTARRIAAEPLDYHDLLVSQLRFGGGAVAQVWSCMTDPVMAYRGVVTGDRGTVEFDLYDAAVRWAALGAEPVERRWEPPGQWSPEAWILAGGIGAGEAAALAALLTDFRDACQGHAPPLTLADGAAVTELAQAGYRSLASGVPVDLPLDATHRATLTYLEPTPPEDA